MWLCQYINLGICSFDYNGISYWNLKMNVVGHILFQLVLIQCKSYFTRGSNLKGS
jgi:hypothetical protein